MASDIRKQISAAAENSRNGQVFVDHAGKRHWNTTGRVLMEKILYDLMDWAGIEELVYSEASDPGRLLGEHVIKEGLLIQAFLPNAAKVSVKIGEESFPMEMADENGFFAVLLEDRLELVPYHFLVTYADGASEEIVDPYSYQFYTAVTEENVKKFGAGCY